MEMQAFPERIGLFAIVPIREGRRTSINPVRFRQQRISSRG
jgi:hypothetical protein